MGIFNLQGFSAQKSMIANGSAAAALNRIRTLLTKLLHSPETGVLYLQSDEGAVSITKGMICAVSTDTYQVVRADADGAPAAVRGFAFCLNDSIAPSAWGYFRFAGEVEALLENGLDPDHAEPILVSDTAGFSTNVAPAVERRVGLIIDASDYVEITYPFVKAIIEPCCAIVAE